MNLIKSGFILSAMLIAHSSISAELKQLPTHVGGRVLESTTATGEKAYEYSWPAIYFETAFKNNGWSGTWRNGIFDYHHFHSNAHEALGIASGCARVQLGGRHGLTFEVGEGDMLVLPAGTGHINLGASGDFVVVGAYPAGQEGYDICRSLLEDTGIEKRIAGVALPASDPLLGADGPLTRLWRK